MGKGIFDPGRSIYGPYNVLLATQNEGKQLDTFPYARVRGSQFLISVADNVATIDNLGSETHGDICQFFNIAEISIWGMVAGYQTCLKRQHVRSTTGPMQYTITLDTPWETIAVYGRNMSGGRRGSPPNGEIVPPTSPPGNLPANPSSGFYLNVFIHIQGAN